MKKLIPLILMAFLSAPALANTDNEQKTESLADLFANYHLVSLYILKTKDEPEPNKAFSDCMENPYPQMTQKYQEFFNLPEHRDDFKALEKQLNEGDQRGMGTAMAIMSQMTLGSMLDDNAPKAHQDIGKEIIRLSKERIESCQPLLK